MLNDVLITFYFHSISGAVFVDPFTQLTVGVFVTTHTFTNFSNLFVCLSLLQEKLDQLGKVSVENPQEGAVPGERCLCEPGSQRYGHVAHPSCW